MGNTPSHSYSNEPGSVIDRAYGHAEREKQKPQQLKEPAFEGYVAGWRQAEFDDDAEEMEFRFATFQSQGDGYEGDDEDSEYPDCATLEPVPSSPTRSMKRSAPLASPRDERTWKERKNASPEREGDGVQTRRPKEVSTYQRRVDKEKRLNSSHKAILGGSASGASVKMALT